MNRTDDPNGRSTTPFGPLASPSDPTPRDRSYWVVTGRLIGGAYPYHADPVAGEGLLSGLVASGIDAFVDLTQAGLTGSPDAHLADYHHSPALPASAEVVHRPIRDLGLPTIADAVGTLDEIDRLLGDGRTVYVHCWGGIGRTGLVLGTWLLRHGAATPETVLPVLADLRRADTVAGGYRAPQTDEQRRFVVRFPG